MKNKMMYDPQPTPEDKIEGDKGEGWQRISEFGSSRIVDGKRNICSMFSESEEFASLIAAAPDMYNALKCILDNCDNLGQFGYNARAILTRINNH